MPVRQLPAQPVRELPASPAVERMPAVKSLGQVRKELAERERQLVAFHNDTSNRIGEREMARARLAELRHWRSRLHGLIDFQRS